MARESKKKKTERAIEVCKRLDARYPDADTALDYTDPFTLTIAVLLSAQTTDAQVNKVTPELFDRWPDPYALAGADPAEVGEVIRSIGFYNTKARNAIATAKKIVTEFDGQVPQTMKELTSLPGVGRKTANIVLNTGFGIVEGIAVDTHVYRIAKRLKLTNAKSAGDPAEKDLLNIIPREYWSRVNITWILFGREICSARSPKCPECPLNDICPSVIV